MNVFAGLAEPLVDRPCVLRSEPLRFPATPHKPPPKPRVITDTPWGLTEMQLLVIDLVAQGKTSKEVARELKLSIQTVSTHVMRAKEKMGARSALVAAVLYDRWKRAQ